MIIIIMIGIITITITIISSLLLLLFPKFSRSFLAAPWLPEPQCGGDTLARRARLAGTQVLTSD